MVVVYINFNFFGLKAMHLNIDQGREGPLEVVWREEIMQAWVVF